MKTIPAQLRYGDRMSPIAFPSIFKEWILPPMSSNKQWANNDTVRFLFQNLGNGVYDPNTSFIQFTIETNLTDNPVGLMQVDGSAQSLIDQVVIYSNNAEVQRITHYSVIANYLEDVELNQPRTEGRDMEGFGYCSITNPPQSRMQTSSSSMRYNLQNPPLFSQSFPTTIPTIGDHLPDSLFSEDANYNDAFNCSKSVRGHISNSNPVIFPNDQSYQNNVPVTFQQRAMQKQGYMTNMRGQYVSNYQNNRFIDSTTSIPNVCLSIDESVHKNQYPYTYEKNKPYITVPNPTIDFALYGQNNSTSVITNRVDITSSSAGFGTLYSPLFSKGTFEPFISPTVPQNGIQNGQFLRTRVPVRFRRFKVTLKSGLMGTLMKKRMLMPLQSINTVLMELTLDPYAFFTSGYCDYSQLDSQGMNRMQQRNYQITRIQYRLQTYHYYDQQVNEYISQSLYKQIAFTTTFWSLGNQYQIPGGTPPNNSYNLGSTSLFLKSVVALFHPNDYQTYSFCRKHFRISNCITKLWMRVGVDYYPPQPFKGNGGNPYPTINDYESDNSVYIENIYWYNNYMFNLNDPLPRINPFNFAINDRPYNPTNRNTFYDASIYDNPNYNWSGSSVNADTALGMSWIHQNRCVGKAAYIIPFTTNTSQEELLSGINVRNVNTVEVVFEADSKYVFPRDQTLSMFCQSSVAVTMNKNGISVYGR